MISRRAIPLAAGAALLAAVLTASPEASAINDPQLAWYTLETEHFNIHYPTGLEPIARRVAQVSEAAHLRLKGPLGYEPSSRVEVLITDTAEFANGFANIVPYNAIRLFVSSPDDFSPLNDYDDWYLALVTHEHTHILHIDNAGGVATIINAILGKTYTPNQAQPRWLTEGLATLFESGQTGAGRLRSSIFDMFMRADVIEDNIAGLDDMCGSPQRWPQGTIWYLYGSRFLHWIAETYGLNVLKAVSQDYGSVTVPLGLNRSIWRQTGRTYPELYEGFKDRLKRQYKEQMRQVEARGLREGKPITNHGSFAAYPRFVPRVARKGKGEEILYYRDDFNERTGLYRLALDIPPGEKERPTELVARTRGITAGSHNDAGDLYFTSAGVYRNFYERDDIYFLPQGKEAPRGDEPERKRLTQGQRTATADVRRDGKQIVFTVNARGTQFLEVADIGKEGQIENKRDLVPSQRFEQVYTPRYSPDGKLVAYSFWRAGGYRDVRIVDVATGKIRVVTNDRAVDMQPVFSADQRTLFFSSDRTGIPNIYAFDLQTEELKQVTNVRTGAMSPAVSEDGKTLVYQGYSTRGYDLFAMPLDPARYLPAIAAPKDRPDPVADPGPVKITKKPYNPFWTVRPRNWLFDLSRGKFSDTAFSLTTEGADIAGLHRVAFRLTADPSAPAPDVTLSYNFSRLPVDLGVRAFHSVTPRGGYQIGGEEVTYNERTLGVSTGISFPIRDEFTYQSVSMSYNIAAYSGDFPVRGHTDPFAPITVRPPEGTVGIVHLGYYFTNVEQGQLTPGSARGFTFTFDVDFGGDPTASAFSSYAFNSSLTGYIPNPFYRKHTLALRAAGGVSGGEYPRGNTYFVGGYNLDRAAEPDAILSGIFNGAVALRGYPVNGFGGKEYVLANAEYRFPIAVPEVGLATLPIYLRRIDGNIFSDLGGAFRDFDVENMGFFRRGRFLDTDLLHASVGAELWINAILFYGLGTQFRLGYARGLTPKSLIDGQLYFVASGAY